MRPTPTRSIFGSKEDELMKRMTLRILVVSCAIALIAAFGGIREAQADTITMTNAGVPIGPGVWTYAGTQLAGTLDPAAGTSGSPPHGTFITIYDFFGYVAGSEFAPDSDPATPGTTEWRFSYLPLGLTPTAPVLGVGVPDNPAVGNLVWEYFGTAGVPLAPGSLFGATSTSPFVASSFFSSQDKSTVAGTDESVASGPVLVPSVPDSGSTLAFLGLGLMVVATLGRKILV